MKLIIAEKQIAARRIAEILAGGKPKAKKEGRIYVYEADNETRVLPLSGHILTVDYPKAYNDWRTTNLHSLVEAPLEYVPTEPGIIRVLEKYAPKATQVIVSTDFDTEGESIGREA